MKQYLVVKIAQQLGSLIEMIPVAGLFPLEAAEQFVRNAVATEPESLFLIQQVGNASSGSTAATEAFSRRSSEPGTKRLLENDPAVRDRSCFGNVWV